MSLILSSDSPFYRVIHDVGIIDILQLLSDLSCILLDLQAKSPFIMTSIYNSITGGFPTINCQLDPEKKLNFRT